LQIYEFVFLCLLATDFELISGKYLDAVHSHRSISSSIQYSWQYSDLIRQLWSLEFKQGSYIM
jgi:hypothetical protein